jgi:transposase
VGGFPIAGHVFRGNVADKTTVQHVVEDLERRFGIKRIIFVADKGMVSQHNLLALVHHNYILGHKGRRDKDAERWLSTLTEKWRDCSEGVRVQEVESGEEGVRVLIVESEERKEYEERLRDRSMKRAERHLRKVAEAVEQGKLKSKEKIAVRADRALHKNKGYRYFSYKIPSDGHFEYFLDEEKMKAELLREGRYIVTTNHPHVSPREAVARYKELSDIEAGFREFKDIIQGRPIYHQREDRIGAHLFIAQLALLLFRQLRYHLNQKDVLLSPSEALAAVKSIGVAELDLKGDKEVLVSRPKPHARQVLTALGITDLDPPGSIREKTRSAARKKAM